ncbi:MULTISPECIES: hypothetical protein [unclassified Methylobacterium]|uniref:hypothetical protein n=1 Tax=unclassified Methylobacterium TaxID=2615210 RepID=UPI0011C1DBEC|nr:MULTISPECIES: hypothetical protein [unclassified Methylobacterium]QEE40593.1 hypothetical protein FVA80_17985 [Methylobacterium sp. WL1]TXN59302.1 hypothetical protein FV241_03765 [Methylobacterium sp. WL2]
MSASATIGTDMPACNALNVRLSRIAAVAGIPVEAFFTESVSATHGGLIELIRLWDAAETETVRAEILAGTQAVVAGASDNLR